jgi:type IV pilus assembly protein PilE
MQRSRGFTLIEIIVVVMIIGILAAIAFPSYNNQVRKSNRAAAKSWMLGVANVETQYLMQARAYGDLTALGTAATLPSEVSKFYTATITVTAGTPPTYTITVTPVSGTTQVADGWLAIDQDGNKTSQYSDKW